MKSLLNSFAIACFRLLPSPLARHLLFLLRSQRDLTDRWGWHLRPIHYYEPLPDFAKITPARARRRREPSSINFNLESAAEMIHRLAKKYRDEIEALALVPEPDGFNFQNAYFSGLDAGVYYGLIRDLKPARVIEIGGGYSTRIAAKALQRNREEGHAAELVCIEPYPETRLTEARLKMELVQQPVESLDLSFFSRLKSGDILFIDSSHSVKFGSDVCREFLDILPTLAPGVVVHVHDIFFPYDYPEEWLVERRLAFNEQYLLEAFLAYNSSFQVMVSNYWLNLEHPASVADLWPGRPPGQPIHGCASFWMRRVS